jgi:hypothetical protein
MDGDDSAARTALQALAAKVAAAAAHPLARFGSARQRQPDLATPAVDETP